MCKVASMPRSPDITKPAWHTAAANLKAWIRAHGLTAVEVSRRIGISEASLSYYLSCKRNPRPALRERIRIYTRGAIRPEEWRTEEELDLLDAVRPWNHKAK
jgi:transcriptional regulator with XRE-family HTH domain